MQLRIMTYNIHRAIGVDRRFRPDRIVQVVEHHRPDVLLFQEVDEGVPRSREVDLAKELASLLDYPHYAVGHNVTLRKGRYGNATLSRHPILKERNIDLTIGERKRRGCQHTRILVESPRGGSFELDAFNLHLGLSAHERARQVGKLVRSGEFKELPEGAATLVAGDFNDWRSLLHPIFTEILSFRCATQHPTRWDSLVRTYPAFSPRGGLDRIYYRGPLRMLSSRACRLRVSKVASDHLPIVADLELHH
jgi:endonuclease/exonuclease/phosphatase family metal-dependent hydrolase